MTDWRVRLAVLQGYGEDMLAQAQTFGDQSGEQIDALAQQAAGMAVDPRFTEAVGLRDAAVKDADRLHAFTTDMTDGIGSYGQAAIVSHQTYGGADQSAQQELAAVRDVLNRPAAS